MQQAPDSGAQSALKLSLVDDIREIDLAAAKIEAHCAENGLAPEIAFDIKLAVDEFLTNTISYGYDEDREHRIGLVPRLEGDMLVVEITDDSSPFDPSQMLDTDTWASLESRRIGGLGVYFVRRVMDGVAYRREDGCNIVTLTKRTTGTESS